MPATSRLIEEIRTRRVDWQTRHTLLDRQIQQIGYQTAQTIAHSRNLLELTRDLPGMHEHFRLRWRAAGTVDLLAVAGT
jgi:hypothetical protein